MHKGRRVDRLPDRDPGRRVQREGRSLPRVPRSVDFVGRAFQAVAAPGGKTNVHAFACQMWATARPMPTLPPVMIADMPANWRSI